MLTKGLVVLALMQYVFSLSEVDRKCVNQNQNIMENTNLLGKWYFLIDFNPVYTFAFCDCRTLEFTVPTAEDILKYKEKYNETVPYSFDDDSVLVKGTDKLTDGAIFGRKEAKFYVLSPSSALRLIDGYSAQVYRKINDDYFLTYDCSLRKNFMKLFSRRRDPDEEELKNIVASIPDVKDLHKLRLCWNKNCDRVW